MAVTVRIPTPLRELTKGERTVEVEGSSLAECIAALERRYPGMKARLVDDGGSLKHYVIAYVNGEDVRFLKGMSTTVKSGDEVSIVPAVAGGC